MAFRLCWFLALVSVAAAEYVCVCNYNVEESVRTSPSSSGQTIGYMYEFDCKQRLSIPNLDAAWYAVAFEHHMGYVQVGTAIQVQTCQGSPPVDDLVTSTTAKPKASTTTPKPTTTTTTPNPTTTTTTLKPTTTTTTPKPTTTTTTPKPTTTTTTPKPTTTTTTPKPTTTTPKPTTTTTTPKPTTTTTTPKPTTTTTTPKPTTTTTTTTPKPTTTTTTPKPTTTTTTPKPTTTTTTPKPTTTTTTPKPTTTTTTSKPTSTTTTYRPTTTSTTPKPTTTTTTHIPSTTTKRQTTHLPTTLTTSISKTSALPNLCSDLLGHHINSIKGQLVHHGQTCYEVVTQSVSWTAAEHDCNTKGGYLMHIANKAEQHFIYTYLLTHSRHRVWIGLNDERNEETFEWTSGDPVTYTNWSPNRQKPFHVLENCVELDPFNNGYWNDKDCDTDIQDHYGYVCQFGSNVSVTSVPLVNHATTASTTAGPRPTVHVTHAPVTHTTTTASPGVEGNINLCRPMHKEHSQQHGTILAQHSNFCYELFPAYKMSWQHGEDVCQGLKGHLVAISKSSQQNFIQGFMQRHMSQRAVWIGMNDLNREGHFEWTSGIPVNYRHFIRHHYANTAGHNVENCVILIPYKNGHWDDIPCGDYDGVSDYGEKHYVLCQFPIAGFALIG